MFWRFPSKERDNHMGKCRKKTTLTGKNGYLSDSKSLVILNGEDKEPQPLQKNNGIVVLLIITSTTCGLHDDAGHGYRLI